MKLKRFLLRYYPPGIILECLKSTGETETKSIDLLNLTPDTDLGYLIDQIILEEPLITSDRKTQLLGLIQSISIIRINYQIKAI